MKFQATLVAVLMSSMVLAGCTEEAPTDGGNEVDPTVGSISGLFVDDNFRPVQIKEDWGSQVPGDYQDQGFILLVETAARLETTANGEFRVDNLPPGTYTLRLAANQHEATERSVQVNAQEETAITYEARRKASGSNPILTIEYSGFVPCAATGVTFDCTTDFSGDTYRAGPREDFRKTYGTDAHYIIVEAVVNQPGIYDLEFRESDLSGGGGRFFTYDSADDTENPYMKVILENSAVWSDEHNPRFKGQNEGARCYDAQIESHEEGDYCSWPNAFPEEDESYDEVEMLVFYLGDNDAAGIGIGPGARLAIQFNYVVSIFLGEPTPYDDTPEDDLNDYCVLCKGYLKD